MAEEIVEIKTLGPQGDGIAVIDGGHNVYVPRSAAGDKMLVKSHKNKQGIYRGEVVELVSGGASRAEAPCAFYEECGGCQLQHIRPDVYQDWKTEQVYSALKYRDVVVGEVLPPVFVPSRTRRRASWSALVHGGEIKLGYNQQRSHKIANIDKCLILCPALDAKREASKPYLKRLLREGKRASIFMQMAEDKAEMLITGELSSRKGVMDLAIMEAVAELAQNVDIARVSWRVKDSHTPNVMIERDPFIKRFGRLQVALPPGAFMQPSAEGEKALVDAVMGAIHGHVTKKKPRFADLFSGSGCFAGSMVERGSVDAYEFAEEPIALLAKAAGGMGIATQERNLFERPLSVKELDVYDAVVFDPPRAGAKEQVEQLAGSKVPLVIGVSCNPKSFARDAQTLVQGGYTLQSVQCVDQFVYSSHVEIVGVFTR